MDRAVRPILPILLTLALGTCFASAGVAQAAIRASGVLCDALGNAAVSSPDGRLLSITNIGSSGQDGVEISLGSVSGHRMSSSSSWSSSDAGASFSFTWVQVSGPSIFNTRCGITRTTDGMNISLDVSEVSSWTSTRVLLYSNNALLQDLTLPSLSSFSVLTSSGSTTVPEVSYDLDLSRSLGMFSILSGTTMECSLDGTPVSCDRIVLMGEMALVSHEGRLLRCDATATNPSGASLSSVEFDSQSFSRFGSAFSISDFDMDGAVDVMTLSLPSLQTLGSLEVSKSLPTRVFGHHAGGGGGGAGGLSFGDVLDSMLNLVDDGVSMYMSRTSPLVFDPATDDGSSFECRLLGSSSCSPTGELAAVELSVSSGSVSLNTRFSGMCADEESVFVYRRGQLVASGSITVSGSLTVAPPPGGSPIIPLCQGKSTQVTRSNISNNLRGPGGDAAVVAGGAGEGAFVVGSDGLSLGMEFVTDRVFCWNGQCATGDLVMVQGRCTDVSCPSSTASSSSFSLHRSSSGSSSSSSSSMSVMGMSSGAPDEISAVIPATVAISSTTPTVTVPVVFSRTDTQPVRATSVTLQLSSSLILFGGFDEGTYFSSHGSSQMFVVDNGGGSYTVDLALLGSGCGPTEGGTLFSFQVARAPGAPDGTGFVRILECDVAECSGGQLPGTTGGDAFVVLDGSSPSPVSTLTATQVLSGNDTDGTTRVLLDYSPPNFDETIEVFRAAYGNYPEYDDAPNAGTVPSPPASYPPGAPWSLVSLQCPSSSGGTGSCSDEPSSRDFYYYVAFVRDAFGNVSSPSARTGGTLNYHLGDVSDGVSSCVGDNQVSSVDISALGAHYGSSVPNGSSFACLDVGPTSAVSVHGRPMTDNRVSFDDLVIFAINYLQVSSPRDDARPPASPANLLHASWPALPAPGGTFDALLDMEGAGDVQALSARLAWDPAVVEPMGVSEGDLLSLQGRGGVVLSPSPGGVDAAILGEGDGIAGRGTLARVSFRVKASGDPAIRVAEVTARDRQNQDVAIGGKEGRGGVSLRTALRPAFPNPFGGSTTVLLSLAQDGEAEVAVFDVLGRHVRTLRSGVQAAGESPVTWDGRDERGQLVGAGVYMVRLQTARHRESRAVMLVR